MLRWLLAVSDSLRQRALVRQGGGGTQAAGRRGEDLAQRYLQKRGMLVVARNWRTRGGRGEVDLIADDRGTLVFVEVKARDRDDCGAPERAIDLDKQQQLARAASEYLRRGGAGRYSRLRFDVVSVILSSPPTVLHARDAFPVPWRLMPDDNDVRTAS